MSGFLTHCNKKLNRFNYLFLIASWIIYFASGRGIVGGIFLCLSGLYALVHIIERSNR